MSFLDTGYARRDDARMVAVHKVLIDAYPKRVDAIHIAGTAGIHQADIADYPKMRHTWWRRRLF